MNSIQRDVLVGVFHDRRKAQEAIAELKRAGFRDEQIGVATRDVDRGAHTTEKSKGSYAEEGAVAGAVTGAGVGGLWALGIAAGMLPAIGPVIAGGLLASILASAATAAAAGGLAGALIGMGIPEEEARHYESELKAGRTVVTVRANGRGAEAWDILNRFGAIDSGSRPAPVATSHQSTAACATPRSTATHATTDLSDAAAGRKIQLKEEELHASTRPVETGEVRVRKEVHTEQKTLHVPVTKEEVVIERHPASQSGAPAGEIREGETIRIPIREDEIHVEKQAVVKEEVTVGKRKVPKTETVSRTVRKEELRVETEGDADVRDRPS